MATSVAATTATILWTTNEPADSQVEYGTTTAYGSSTALDTTKVTSHSVALSGLSPNTLYHYRVKSKDASGNLATSADFTFTTLADTTPPVISAVQATAIGPDGATITWTTNVGTSTIFRYGTAPNQMATQIEQPTATTSHSVMLERLVPNTTYYYQIQACTTAGQCVSTNALPFTTTV